MSWYVWIKYIENGWYGINNLIRQLKKMSSTLFYRIWILSPQLSTELSWRYRWDIDRVIVMYRLSYRQSYRRGYDRVIDRVIHTVIVSYRQSYWLSYRHCILFKYFYSNKITIINNKFIFVIIKYLYRIYSCSILHIFVNIKLIYIIL